MKSKSKMRVPSGQAKLEFELVKAQKKIKKQEGIITALRQSEEQLRSLMADLAARPACTSARSHTAE